MTREAAGKNGHPRATPRINRKSLFVSFSSEKEVCFSIGCSRTDTKKKKTALLPRPRNIHNIR